MFQRITYRQPKKEPGFQLVEGEVPVLLLELEVGLAMELNLFDKNMIVFVHFGLHCGGWVGGGGIELEAKGS